MPFYVQTFVFDGKRVLIGNRTVTRFSKGNGLWYIRRNLNGLVNGRKKGRVRNKGDIGLTLETLNFRGERFICTATRKVPPSRTGYRDYRRVLMPVSEKKYS